MGTIESRRIPVQPLTRRSLLSAVALPAFLGVNPLAGQAQGAGFKPRATADVCVFFNLNGAPSHVDTFDLKTGPWTPPDLRIKAVAPDLQLSTTFFPNLSEFGQDLCVLRGLESWEAAHERGQFYVQTGHSSNPAFNSETPHIGSVVAHELGSGTLAFPAFLALNGPPGQGATFLGGRVEPLDAPADPNGFGNLEHSYYGADSQQRFEQKYKLLSQFEADVRKTPPDPAIADHLAYFDTARRLMYNQSVKNVFTLTSEDMNRYGTSGLGRASIVARNAIQARNGVRFITLFQDGWDTHQRLFDRGYVPNLYALSAELDRAAGSLIADLKASGDFSRVLIVMMGEFGRTPGPLNGRGGRDHHKRAMFAVLCGGGITGGRVLGSTDSLGDRIITPGWMEDRPMYQEDIVATIYSALGIDWTKTLIDTPSRRAFEYVAGASIGRFRPIDEAFR